MKWMRWSVRGIGSTVAGLWLLIGWWKEEFGGIALVTVATIFSAFAWVTAGHNKGFALLISGGPFLVAGILFLMAWWRTGKLAATAMDYHPGKDGHVD